MTSQLTERWEAFMTAFFAVPNELRLGEGVAELDAIIAAAEVALSAISPGPVVVPAKLAGSTEYFAVAFDRDQGRILRDLLRSHVGTTWTDFDGRSLAGRVSLDTLDRAAIALAGQEPDLVYRFEVASRARASVRAALKALAHSLADQPPREAMIAAPVGRLLGDFADACAAGAENAATEAYTRLAADHRISAANRLFLQVQLLATFERWDELEAAPGFGDVLRLHRPALASDAIARLALARLPAPGDLFEFQQIALRFGALIPSVGAIRSVAGARYYCLWSLTAGEGVAAVAERLSRTGWAADPDLSRLLGESALVGGEAAPPTLVGETADATRTAVADAIESGRFDAAVDLLSELEPDAGDLRAVVSAVRETLTGEAVHLLERFRRAFGDHTVRAAMAGEDDSPRGIPTALVSPVSLAERIESLLCAAIVSDERVRLAEAVQLTGLGDLVAPGGLESTVAAIRAAAALPTDQIDVDHGLDICIDLARDLAASGSRPSGQQSLGLAIVELWAFHDQRGDRRRVRRIVQVVDDVLQLGVSGSVYDELVELLRAGWDPFLTDADLPVGLDTIELLLPFRPDGTESLDSFARPVLARIGAHNVRRLSSAGLEVAIDLAPTFGLEIPPLPAEAADLEEPIAPVSVGTVVAIYSLMEQAAERAAAILRRRHAGLEVVTLTDHVASENLRNVARSADLLVVMDRAAKHAATDALRVARAHRPIRYAAGKGSTSVIEAVEAGLAELVGS